LYALIKTYISSFGDTDRKGLSVRLYVFGCKEKDILGFLKLGYEPFHLTGDDGILDELDVYVYDKKI